MSSTPEQEPEVITNTLGLSPFDFMVLKLVRGSSYPMMYAEIGMGVASMVQRDGGPQLLERHFNPRFMSLCTRGLVVWANLEQVFEHPKERRFQLGRPRGDQAMRDFKLSKGDDYRFVRYFDGTANTLDRYLGTDVKVRVNSQEIKKSRIFADHNANPWATKRVLD